MKTRQLHFVERRRQTGSVVFVFIALLAIMMILVAANSRALLDLHQQTKLLERRQVERLNTSQTNATDRAELPLGSDAQAPRQISVGASRVPAAPNGTK